MASSNQYGASAAPPPTPSTQPNILSTSDAADSLARLLHRLPPILSPPSRGRKSPTATPVISFSDPQSSLTSNLISASQLGFFQLTNHSIPSLLAHSAESESLSLLRLPNYQKQLSFPKNWPLGYDDEDEAAESFCFDSACSTESSELSLTSLSEFTREMEKVGLAVIEALSCAVGFENPDPSRLCSLMWISEDTTSAVKIYPYAVGLHYQIRFRKSSMLSDSGWVSVSPQVDSILVTLGDIAQVWSNGKTKKVRGRPVPWLVENSKGSQLSVSMSVLVTLPLDSIVTPLPLLATPIPIPIPNHRDRDHRGVVGNGNGDMSKEDDDDDQLQVYDYNAEETSTESTAHVFNSFSFEDYAWRVYHEPLILKDSLHRYRA